MAEYDKYYRSAAKTGAAEGEAAGRAKGGGLGAAVGTGVGAALALGITAGTGGLGAPAAGAIITGAAALGGAVGGIFGGKLGADKGRSAGRAKAQKQAARGFQKDWKAKKKRQVSAEKGARAKVEQSNLMANMQQKFSDDQILSSSMAEPIEPVRGKGQFDRFEQRTFG